MTSPKNPTYREALERGAEALLERSKMQRDQEAASHDRIAAQSIWKFIELMKQLNPGGF